MLHKMMAQQVWTLNAPSLWSSTRSHMEFSLWLRVWSCPQNVCEPSLVSSDTTTFSITWIDVKPATRTNSPCFTLVMSAVTFSCRITTWLCDRYFVFCVYPECLACHLELVLFWTYLKLSATLLMLFGVWCIFFVCSREALMKYWTSTVQKLV